MSRYRVVHKTGFKYDGAAGASYNEVRLLPARDDNQLVFSSKLEIHPQGSVHEFFDYFGTRTAMFEVLEPHSELSIVSTSVVEVRTHARTAPDLNWTSLINSIQGSLELVDAVTQTRRTLPPQDLIKHSAKLAESLDPHDAAMAICKRVFKSMTYKHGVTGVHSVAAEAWKQKVGVCQDFAHITLGALRSVGIPARYVSGYLYPATDRKIGEAVIGESHAWVEWWAGSWFAFDPTNDIEVLDRHIVVGRGRDYDDVPPLRGVYAGGLDSELFVSVEITKEN
ncbi:MAG: transglutaminase domain-containing protein [Micrococcales bacterium]